MTSCPTQNDASEYHSRPGTTVDSITRLIDQPPFDERLLILHPQDMQSFVQVPMAVFRPVQDFGSGLEAAESNHLHGRFGSFDYSSLSSPQNFKAFSQDWMPQDCVPSATWTDTSRIPINQTTYGSKHIGDEESIDFGGEPFNGFQSEHLQEIRYDPHARQQKHHPLTSNDHSLSQIIRRQSPSSLPNTGTAASFDDRQAVSNAQNPIAKAMLFDDVASSLSANNFGPRSWPKARSKSWRSSGSSRGSFPGMKSKADLSRQPPTGSQASTPSQIGSPSGRQIYSTPSSGTSLVVPCTPPNSLETKSETGSVQLSLETSALPFQFDLGPDFSQSAFFGSGAPQQFMTPAVASSQYQNAPNQEDDFATTFENQELGIEKGPDLFASAKEEISDPPMEDLCPVDGELRPHEQDLRFEGDLYTPRWVRGQGHKREGWCGMCKPGKWLILKNSAFWYDKCFAHGVCPPTGQLFAEPAQFRRSSDNQEIWEGYCGECDQWITLVSSKRKGTSWFRHVAKCHSNGKAREGPKRRKTSGHFRTASTSSLPKPPTSKSLINTPSSQATTANNAKFPSPNRSVSMPNGFWP